MKQDNGHEKNTEQYDPNSLQLEPLSSVRSLDVDSPQQESSLSSDESLGGLKLQPPNPLLDSLDIDAPLQEFQGQDDGYQEYVQKSNAQSVKEPPLGQEEPRAINLSSEVLNTDSDLEVEITEEQQPVNQEPVIVVKKSFLETENAGILLTLIMSFVIGGLVSLYYIRSLYPEPITNSSLLMPTLKTFFVWVFVGSLVAPLIWYAHIAFTE